MHERYGVEWPEQQFQHRQSSVKKSKSEIKQENKMSKTESRFKSKLESLRKFQHSASNSSAVERARAFFRSLELKHLGGGGSSQSDRSSSSSSRQGNSTSKNGNLPLSSSKVPQSSLSSSSSSSIIDDTQNTFSTATTTQDSSFHSHQPSNGIATARIIRVVSPNYSNAKEMIVHRIKNPEQDDYPLASSYFNSTQRNQSYSSTHEKHSNLPIEYNSRSLSPTSNMSTSMTYSSRIYHPPAAKLYPSLAKRDIPTSPMSTSLYTYRPLICRELDPSPSLMSSSLHEQSDRSVDPIIRPLALSNSSSSISTWNQSVRRLNSEYKSTINALQDAKESLKQIYCQPTPPDPISKYANFVARGIENLSNTDTSRSMGVSFCLTAPLSQDSLSFTSSTSSSPQIPKSSVPQAAKTPPLNAFSKPKIVRPLELNTFTSPIPPLPKLEPIPIHKEKNDKVDSIANIIQKFNNLNHSSSPFKAPLIIENNHRTESKEASTDLPPPKAITETKPKPSSSSPHVHFQSTVTTYELEEIPYESPPPLTSSSSSSLASEDSTSSKTSTSSASIENNLLHSPTPCESQTQEETTYTIETFYKNAQESSAKTLLANNQQVVIIRENTTEEEFNLLQEKQRKVKSFLQEVFSERKCTIDESNPPKSTTPLFTSLNSNLKQTTPTPPPPPPLAEVHENSNHSVDPAAEIKNTFISKINRPQDDETVDSIVTSNPYTHSPPTSHRLISTSSSSSTSTASSAATVLLSTNTQSIRPKSADLPKTPSTTNDRSTKTNNHKSPSQIPKRTITSPVTTTNNSRFKQPAKVTPTPSKLKPPSSSSPSTNCKAIRSPLTTSSISTSMATSTSSIRKPTGITTQSSAMTNQSLHKTTQQQTSALLSTGKKQQLLHGNSNLTDAQNLADSSMSLAKNRVRSMVNQLNAAASSPPSRQINPSTVPNKRIPLPTTTTTAAAVNHVRRPINSTESTTKTSTPTATRPPLQRAVTINNETPIIPSPPPTPPSSNTNTHSNIPSAYKRKAPLIRSTSNVKEGLLRWCQCQVAGYPNVSVTNLSSSWSDGLAFCALIHHFFPDAFDFQSLSPVNRQDNFELAFHTAEERAGVPRLLDVSDMLIMGNTPDYKCIFTYLNSFLAKVKDLHPASSTPVSCH